MKRFVQWIAALCIAAAFLCSLSAPSLASISGGSPSSSPTAGGSHSWEDSTLSEGQTVTTGQGTKVSKHSPNGLVSAKWCPGKQDGAGAHPPHEMIKVDNGASAVIVAASGPTAGNNSDIDVGDDATVVIVGDGFGAPPGPDTSPGGIDITGDGSTVAYAGNGSDIEFSSGSQGNALAVSGNNNDIDLNGTNNAVSIVSGTGNLIHN